MRLPGRSIPRAELTETPLRSEADEPCGGRRSVMADINDPSVVVAIVVKLGLPTEPPPIARTRSASFEAA